jgi:restriction system protein
MKELFWMVLGIIFLGVIAGLLQPSKKRKRKRVVTKKNAPKKASANNQRSSKTCRPDEVLLTRPLEDLNGAEFERLLALYFKDQGYTVREVGVGGNDGGVDLFVTDKRGEKIAVQAKCYADHNLVPVMTVRELVGAKRNHDCILSLLVTTSDLTAPAKKEAEQFKVDYWHGGLVKQKLIAWGKWQPSKKNYKGIVSKGSEISNNRIQVATSIDTVCICGSQMVQRKGKEGKPFYGCSEFPKCRYTKSI